MTEAEKRIVIVEDDPLISLDIQEVLEEHGYQISGIFHSGEKAEENISDNVDLALLDINLDGVMTGIELGTALKSRNIPCIFITSYYDEKTLHKAKKADPLAYIIKPYEEHDIVANIKLAFSKINDLRNKNPTAEEPNPFKPVFIKSGSKMQRILPDEIDYIEAYDIYSQVWIDGKRITVSHTLKNIGTLLDFAFLVRIHRSYIININKVEAICEDVVLVGDQRIPIGRTFKKTFFDRIQLI